MSQPGAWAVPGDIAGSGTDEPDGLVGIDDLNRVLGNWNHTCDPGDWTEGDITGDGFVSSYDLNIVLGHWNQRDPDPFIGTNLAPIAYWSTSWTFVDVMKMARPWLTTDGSTFNTGLEVDTDANGWPTENPVDPSNLPAGPHTVFTHVFNAVDGHYPAGDYILTWDGTADITVEWDGSVSSSTPGRKVVPVTPTNLGIKINIDNIDPNDPPKNIRLWMPGFENAQSPFHPLFIQRLRPFKVLRFMDWQKINDSDEVQWADRKQLTYAFQNDSRGAPTGNPGGVALEYMIQLCNELEADPWFCMPAKADDSYVTQFAQYVKGNLHANATIYAEYSNELWNDAPQNGFTQYQWLEEQATIRTGAAVHVRENEWFHQWAIESTNDFDIWKTVFSQPQQDPRDIVRVMGGHKTLVWIVKKLIPWMYDPNDPAGKDVLFDALACSTYFYSDTDDLVGVENILQNTINRIQTDDLPDYEAHSLEARKLSDPVGYPNTYTGRTITFISYEGGQHYVPLGNQDLLDAQRHPLIYKAYIDNIKAFREAGGGGTPWPWGGKLYMAYHTVGKFSNDEAFGHFEYQDESINNAPKHRAVVGGGGR
jgi:hypothetical protein